MRRRPACRSTPSDDERIEQLRLAMTWIEMPEPRRLCGVSLALASPGIRHGFSEEPSPHHRAPIS